MSSHKRKYNRRKFLKRSAAGAATIGGIGYAITRLTGRSKRVSSRRAKKVIVIGIDGMDPRLCDVMMDAGELPNLAQLRARGGYRRLATTIPPQSPVAWAGFLTGADSGTHGIFDFVHRNPDKQYYPIESVAQTIPGEGGWEIGEYKLPLTFWPFQHSSSETVLQRKGVLFWNYLDQVGIRSRVYMIPANYPPNKSKQGHHCCLAGMGTPDLMGTYGTYQHFAEDGSQEPVSEGGGRRYKLTFHHHKARAELVGPRNDYLKTPRPTSIDFTIHRDIGSDSACIEIAGEKIVLKAGQFSRWVRLQFRMRLPQFMPDETVSGICRFYLQEVSPNFRLYVSPVNADPSNPAIPLSEPIQFIKDITQELGLFYTTGFQEDHKAFSNGVFDESEFINQSSLVLNERMNLLHYAMDHFTDGFLFFYFSSTDLQAHMLWTDQLWNSESSIRHGLQAYEQIRGLYKIMDGVIGEVHRRFGKEALILTMSDHGFAEFRREFDLNAWLRNNGYIYPSDSPSLLLDVDWGQTKAYGLGINGLYINQRGREREGIVGPDQERDNLLRELTVNLEGLQDDNGDRIIRKVYRTDQVFHGPETRRGPDLIIGYRQGYRTAWHTCLGNMSNRVITDNQDAWRADHCIDPHEVPGILFSNRPVREIRPSIIDLAPTILAEYGIKRPATMTGKNIL